MKSDFYKKLADLYAGDELPTEWKEELELEALGDPELSHELMSLATTLRALRSTQPVPFTEEINQRILLKMRLKGAEVETKSPEVPHWQYHLPMNG